MADVWIGRRSMFIWRWVTFRLHWRFFVTFGNFPPGIGCGGKTGSSKVERWWFPERARPMVSRTAAGRREEARSLIADAVRLRLRSDVPVALALSGGVDSTVIAAEAARQDVRTDAFTVIAEGDETDLPYARLVAQKYGLRHEVLAGAGVLGRAASAGRRGPLR